MTGGFDYHHGANVKDYNVYRQFHNDHYPERIVARAYDEALVLFWDELDRIAVDLGYDGVYQDGRSGGWAIPQVSQQYVDEDDPNLNVFIGEAHELMKVYRKWFIDRVEELVLENEQEVFKSTAMGNHD